MKASAIREMGLEDLRHKETELREQLFRLRVQRALGQLESSLEALGDDVVTGLTHAWAF